jgi:hypothetical protein
MSTSHMSSLQQDTRSLDRGDLAGGEVAVAAQGLGAGPRLSLRTALRRGLEQVRAESAREREELHGGPWRPRAQVLEEARADLRARARRAERELGSTERRRGRHGSARDGGRPSKPARGNGRRQGLDYCR